MANIAFLMANSFFKCILKNTDQKNICASIVLKLSQSWNTKNFLGGVLKLKFWICFSAFVLLSKKKLHADFYKKLYYLGPLEYFENENLAACSPARAACAAKIWIWTYKIMLDLWLSAVFCTIKKIQITPPYCIPGEFFPFPFLPF